MAFLKFKSNETFYYSNISNIKDEEKKDLIKNEKKIKENLSLENKEKENIYSCTHVWYFYNNTYKKMEICAFNKLENTYNLKRKDNILENIPADKVTRCLKDEIEVDSENNIDILQLNEENVMENLRNRYKKNKIYTFHASLLLAINPYKQIKGLYNVERMNTYLFKFKNNEINNNRDFQTHIYDIGNMAYRNMILKKKRQTIIVSGHSGSGKTENCKFLFKYFHYIFFNKNNTDKNKIYKNMNSYLNENSDEEDENEITEKNELLSYNKELIDNDDSKMKNMKDKNEKMDENRSKKSSFGEMSEVINYERIDKLIYINNIIESMSNAKTIKNNNSSRCGRINDLIFVEKKKKDDTIFNYCFSNIKILILLLEINRCITQNIGERNFHVFYQLIWGLTDEQLKKRNLIRDIHYYNLLNNDAYKMKNLKKINGIEKNNSIEIDRHRDEKNFEYLLNGLRYINYDENKINQFYDVIAGIIHLGEIDPNEDDLLSESYKNACECLKIDLNDLQNTIKYKNINVSFEQIRTHRNKDNSLSTLHTLIKVIYKNLFNRIINDINITNLSNEEKEQIMNEHIYSLNTNVISILDLYGFEELSCNDFEQLCINLANEKLNNYYINNEIEKEKVIYKSENLLWNDIKIPNFKETITFIEKMFANLDDITKLNSSGQKKVDDHFFTYLLNNEKSYLENNIYGFLNNKDNKYTKKRQNVKKNKFFIKHYAGHVTYNINNWIHKNSDKIEVEIENIIKTSTNLFLKGDDEFENEKKYEEEKEEYKFTSSHGDQDDRILKKNKEKYYTCENIETGMKSKNNIGSSNNKISVENDEIYLENNKNYLKNEKNDTINISSIEKEELINKLNNSKKFLKVDISDNRKYSNVNANSLVNMRMQRTNLSASSMVYNISGSNSNIKNNILSVSKKYIKELDRLFNNLQKTDMYYIRCILPNEKMEKDHFKRRLVYAQLKQCGANEMIKIINNGLSHKILKDKLLEKCRNCIPSELQYCGKDDTIYYFMRLFDDSKNFKIGTNYIFMKSHIYTQINYFFYNNCSLNDNVSLKKEKEIFKEIRIMRFRRCVTVIKINNWINKYYRVYLEKKKEMKRKVCDYIYKMYLIYKTMISIKKTFSYNVKKLNRIFCNLGYYFAFKRMKNTRKNTFLIKLKKKEEAMKNKKDELEEKMVNIKISQNKELEDKLNSLKNKVEEPSLNETNDQINNKEKLISKLHENEETLGLQNVMAELFVSTPDNYHYIYNNLDWIIMYINKKLYFYNIFYNYEKINKKCVLSYDSIKTKKLYPIKNENIHKYEESSEYSLIEINEKKLDENLFFEKSCNLKENTNNENLNKNIQENKKEILNKNLGLKKKKDMCYLLRDFHCINQHNLYKNIFIGIDKSLNLIIFTYPNLRTIKKFLKKKIKSIKHSNGNLPKTYLPLLYKSNNYDTHLQKKVDNEKQKCEAFLNNCKKENICKNKNEEEFETDEQKDVFSEENLNMFIHMYKNIYVLSNLENVFKKEKEEKNYKKEVIETERTKLKTEFYDKNDKIKEDTKFKETNKNKNISFSSFIKELKKEEYIMNELYSNPSFKILKICFLPSSISYFSYLAYSLINENHYLLLTIVNFLSKPIYKYTTYILINNVINNEDFFSFFIKSYNHININNNINTDNNEKQIEKKNVINNENLDKYLSTLKMSIINNSHILIYGSCLLSLIEIKKYDLNNINPYIKEYEYKYLKLIFNLYCFEYFNNVYDSYMNKLSYDLKHNLIINDLFKNEKKKNFIIPDESKKSVSSFNENDELNKDMKENCEFMFYIFSLFNEIYLLTNKNEVNSVDVLFNYENWKIIKLKNSNTGDTKNCTFQGVMNMNINYYYNKNYYKSFIALNSSIQATFQKYYNNNNNNNNSISINYPYKSVFPDVYVLKEMRYNMCKRRNGFYYNLKNQELFTLYNEKEDELITSNDDKYLSYNILAYTPLNHLDTILLLNYSNEMNSYSFEFINIVSKSKKIITLDH
ncbi:myosin D, putative [Plasmodium gallinaceum]|uniref:Myosin D, putative n=1 Tax=Plasmodium gallinaceum TaxID=5849 RepID=A0A1J1GWU4_PLAGA|nr:myosin D, putative [Plasmodium gallinaceum]CRG96935.1 myosin D, putative [Plasmodium gallinaceum]